jgi:hypothetical protein
MANPSDKQPSHMIPDWPDNADASRRTLGPEPDGDIHGAAGVRSSDRVLDVGGGTGMSLALAEHPVCLHRRAVDHRYRLRIVAADKASKDPLSQPRLPTVIAVEYRRGSRESRPNVGSRRQELGKAA